MSAAPNVPHSDEPPQPPTRAMPGDKARTKKWAPKTFNGCLTCKKRRIKCDESKPACQRCIKSNIRCGGYAPPKIRLFDPTATSTSTSTSPPPPLRAALPVDPEPPPPDDSQSQSYPYPQDLAIISRFGTQEEYQSFHFFLEKTSDLISVYSQPYLWNVFLPQATWHQSSIKHSIIALASLHRSLTTLGPVSQRANRNFVFHYNNAIRALIADKPPIHIVLATCVIFWALENFNGGGKAAFDHMKAAIMILGEWKSKRRANDPTNDLISKHIEPSIRDGVKFASKYRMEELASQMSALSLTSRDMRIMNINYPAFNSLEDAGDYLGDCINKVLTLQTQTQAAVHRERAAPIEEIEELDARLYKWMHLFQNLTGTGPVYMRRMLIVHNVAANILLEQLKTQAQYNTLTNNQQDQQQQDRERDSQEGAGRCRHHFAVVEVEDMLRYEPLATMELCRKRPLSLGVLPPIFLVATSADKVETRQRAINTLRLLNVSEGPWSAVHAARIAEGMLEIARECAVAPGAVELQHMSFDFDDDQQTLSMEWKPEDAMLQNVATVKSIDASGMACNGSDISELIRRYGYQRPTSNVSIMTQDPL